MRRQRISQHLFNSQGFVFVYHYLQVRPKIIPIRYLNRYDDSSGVKETKKKSLNNHFKDNQRPVIGKNLAEYTVENIYGLTFFPGEGWG